MGGGRAGFSRVGRLGGRSRVRRSHRFADRRGRARSCRRSRTPHRRGLSETVPTSRAQPDDATLTQVLSGLKDEGYDGDVIIEERSEEHTSELQSLMRISYAVFCLKKKKKRQQTAT